MYKRRHHTHHRSRAQKNCTGALAHFKSQMCNGYLTDGVHLAQFIQVYRIPFKLAQ